MNENVYTYMKTAEKFTKTPQNHGKFKGKLDYGN